MPSTRSPTKDCVQNYAAQIVLDQTQDTIEKSSFSFMFDASEAKVFSREAGTKLSLEPPIRPGKVAGQGEEESKCCCQEAKIQVNVGVQ